MITAATAMMINWRTALSIEMRVSMIKLVHRSIHVLFSNSLDAFR